MYDQTGTKWNPTIYLAEEKWSRTYIEYNTAWAPNNLLLKRLHEMTLWRVMNEYEEEQPEFEGVFECG